jgi:hypothetical protein
LFGEQDFGFVGREVDDLPDATVRQVDPVNEGREFSGEANSHFGRIPLMLA